jgi:hypothetical protein
LNLPKNQVSLKILYRVSSETSLSNKWWTASTCHPHVRDKADMGMKLFTSLIQSFLPVPYIQQDQQ